MSACPCHGAAHLVCLPGARWRQVVPLRATQWPPVNYWPQVKRKGTGSACSCQGTEHLVCLPAPAWGRVVPLRRLNYWPAGFVAATLATMRVRPHVCLTTCPNPNAERCGRTENCGNYRSVDGRLTWTLDDPQPHRHVCPCHQGDGPRAREYEVPADAPA